MGDLNVHEINWLKYSEGSNLEGRELLAFANIAGLVERVSKPTRGPNLLDLVLSDLGTELQCKVFPGISDHDAVVGTVNFNIPEIFESQREFFDYKNAPWQRIKMDFEECDWALEFSGMNADEAAEHLTDKIMNTLRRRVRCKLSTVRTSSHPWLNDRCKVALKKKMEARGTPNAIIERDRCSEILFEEHTLYIMKMRRQLAGQPNSSKKIWKLTNCLQRRTRGSDSVQALKAPDGSWARTPEAKAELLSETFAMKSALPEGVSNEFSALPPGAGPAFDVFSANSA